MEITTPQALPNGTVGKPYAVLLQATGGTPPLNWQIPSAQIPSGLSLDPASGTISGVPVLSSFATAYVIVNDASTLPQQASKYVDFKISDVLAVITTALPTAIVGVLYKAVLQAAGGFKPYLWSVEPSMPAGLILDPASGEITGTPQVAKTSVYTFTVTDQLPTSASVQIDLEVGPPSVAIETSELPSTTVGGIFHVTLQASGGTPPYRWLVQGNLPQGLSLDSSAGLVAGTPQVAGTTGSKVTVMDSLSTKASRMLNFTVEPAPSISTRVLPGPMQGQPYSGAVEATGGLRPFSWSAGGLPNGIRLDAGSGHLSGTPQGGGGGAKFTVTDQASATVSKYIPFESP